MVKISKSQFGYLFLLVVLGYVVYRKLTQGDSNVEKFALSSKVFTDVTALDPSKFYYRGTRAVSNTVSPAQNGGTTCQEFPTEVYMLAEAINATCKGEIQDSFYNFDDVAVKATVLYPRFFAVSTPIFNTTTKPTGYRWITFYGNNAVLIDSGNGIYFSSAFTTQGVSPYFTRRDGLLQQVSINSAGWVGGSNNTAGAGSIFGSYPFNQNGWNADGQGFQGRSLEVGKSTNGPNNPICIFVDPSNAASYKIWGVTNWTRMTQQFSQLAIDETFLCGCNNTSPTSVTNGNIFYMENFDGKSQPVFTPVRFPAAGVRYISANADYRAIAINQQGKLIACRNIKNVASEFDWKLIQTIDPNVNFVQVSFKGIGNTVAAISSDNKLYMEMDISTLFNL